ncbi:MAG: hypothetical protein K8L97_22120 [Anaerolineae bacterium]|nr:hypothetical protein [Anaerolineae bacterium]
MAAQFKSNVRLREEKGFGSVSMKRLIFCGVGAVLIFMVLRLTPLSGIALPALVGVFAALLTLSGSRGGLPLWQHILLGWRGSIVLLAAKDSTRLGGQLATLLNLDTSAAQVHGGEVFATQSMLIEETPFREWALYADFAEAADERGLRFVELGEQ